MVDERDSHSEDAKKPLRQSGIFRIKNFLDLRLLRQAYKPAEGRFVCVDSEDTPRPEERETYYDLRRSTPAEGWQFYLDSLRKDEERDELTEFLDDK